MEHVVVVGAGQAGAALVAKLRGEGFAGRITLIGREPQPPYQRPPLSKAYLLGEMPLERLYLRPLAFYAEKEITLRLGAEVAEIDRAGRTVVLTDGARIGYDALVLTTGADANRLPATLGGDLEGVYTVRDLAGVDAMAPEFAEGRRLLVVGGGYIGLEAAAVAVKLGLQVTLVEQAERILGRVAAAETADYFRALHRRHGVDIREGTGLAALKGEGRVEAAVLEDGTTLEVDVVIVGVGIRPSVALAEAAGLEVAEGIVTDAMGRTSDPAIWAAGDCATLTFKGARIRLESVGNAIDQAEAVAVNLLGAGAPYAAKPWFWSDQYDVKLQIAGLNTGYDRVVVREGAGGARSHWYYADGLLIAVDAMNDPRGYMIGKRLIEAGLSPDPEAVADPSTDLKALLSA